jgi:hypothetical protein
MGTPNPFATTVNATLQFQGNESVTMVEVVETASNNHTATHLGLAERSVFIDALYSAGMITSHSWGLNAGSQSLLYPRSGSLVLGGYDQAAILGAFTTYDIYDASLGQRYCPLQIQIQTMSLRFSDTDSKTIVSTDYPLPACIEPYDNLFRLPSNLIEIVEGIYGSATGYGGATTPIPDPADPSILDLEPGLIYPYLSNSTAKFAPTMSITLNNNFSVEIPWYELVQPLHGLAPNGSRVTNTNFTEVQIYQTADPEEAAVLGKIFLSAVYLHVNYDLGIFQLAGSNTNAPGTPDIVPTQAVACSQSPSDNQPLKLGLIFLGVIVGLLVVAVAWLLWLQWRARAGGTAAEGRAGALGPTRESPTARPLSATGMGHVTGRQNSATSLSHNPRAETIPELSESDGAFNAAVTRTPLARAEMAHTHLERVCTDSNRRPCRRDSQGISPQVSHERPG